ncbi:unnamed protein product, partial [Ectocarpus sp. 13 AM-2016]
VGETSTPPPPPAAAIAAVAFASPANISCSASPCSCLSAALMGNNPVDVGAAAASPPFRVQLFAPSPDLPSPEALPPPLPCCPAEALDLLSIPALPAWPPTTSGAAGQASTAPAVGEARGGRDLRSSHRVLRKERNADLSAASSSSAVSPLFSLSLALLAAASLARLRPLHLASASARQRWLESLNCSYSSRTDKS